MFIPDRVALQKTTTAKFSFIPSDVAIGYTEQNNDSAGMRKICITSVHALVEKKHSGPSG